MNEELVSWRLFLAAFIFVGLGVSSFYLWANTLELWFLIAAPCLGLIGIALGVVSVFFKDGTLPLKRSHPQLKDPSHEFHIK